MATYTLDGEKIISRDEFWQHYLAIVQPEGAEIFGRNLDALNDALWGGPGYPGDDCVIRISSSQKLKQNLGSDFIVRLCEVFAASHSAKLELL
jgi:RNAse (barnase) inhibitor barstar